MLRKKGVLPVKNRYFQQKKTTVRGKEKKGGERGDWEP